MEFFFGVGIFFLVVYFVGLLYWTYSGRARPRFDHLMFLGMATAACFIIHEIRVNGTAVTFDVVWPTVIFTVAALAAIFNRGKA